MIDPDGINITEHKAPSVVNFGQIPECDFYPYDLDDDKSYKSYITDIEREVRGSFEYRQFINYIKNYMDMNRCAFIENAVHTKDNYHIRIEVHHYPFTLYDIVEIVYKKRVYYNESVELEMVAKEVMKLHYESIIGLIPISETVHELVHNGKLFIPIDCVFGRYNIFMDYYDPFITPEQKDIVNRIEKYTSENVSYLLNTTILDANSLTLNVSDQNFALPSMNTLGTAMIEQIQAIKQNDYVLPTPHDKPQIEDKRERQIIDAIYYIP